MHGNDEGKPMTIPYVAHRAPESNAKTLNPALDPITVAP
jgi:hypothetical protein